MYKIRYVLNNVSTYANSSGRPAYREIQVLGTEDEVNQLVKQGYLLIDNLFSDTQLQSLRNALDHVSAAERGNPKTENLESVGHYIRYLLDKDKAFHLLLNMEKPLSISRAVLGPQIYLEVEARVVPAGVPNMGLSWHIHHRVVPDPLPPFFCYPHAIHGLIYLDDVDQATGPICILPGSHLQPHLMKMRSNQNVEGQITLPVKTGTCLLMHANLWHRTLPTTEAAKQRRLILFACTPSWVKSDIGFGVAATCPLREELRQTADPELRELLGEFIW